MVYRGPAWLYVALADPGVDRGCAVVAFHSVTILMDDLTDMVVRFRTLWIDGRYGGGKTALAVWLATLICRGGYADKIVSNTPLNLPLVDKLQERDVYDVKFAVLLLDEAWRYLGKGKSRNIDDWLGYLRKYDQVLLLPSVRPLAADLRSLQALRTMNWQVLGIPLWQYSYMVDDGTGGLRRAVKRSKKERRGRVFEWSFWQPQRVFGLYDHSALELPYFGVYRWPTQTEWSRLERANRVLSGRTSRSPRPVAS